MVVFICGGCNESLKKNKLDNHLARCSSSVVSCCDCGKEFPGASYKKHNVCVSEDQKYGPQSKDAQQTPNLSKGQIKQDNFLQAFKMAIKKCKPSGYLEIALNKLTEYPNIPRKQKKFEKFMQNCVGIKSPDIIAEAWKVFESAKQECISTESSPVKPAKPENLGKPEKAAVKRPLDDNPVQEESVNEKDGEDPEHEENGEPKKKKKKKNKAKKKAELSNEHKDEKKEEQVDNSIVESKDVTLKSKKRKKKGHSNGINGASEIDSTKDLREESFVTEKTLKDNQEKKDGEPPEENKLDRTKDVKDEPAETEAEKKIIKEDLVPKGKAEHDAINSEGNGLPKKKKKKNKNKKPKTQATDK